MSTPENPPKPQPFVGYHVNKTWTRLQIFHFRITGQRMMVETEIPNKGLSIDERKEVLSNTIRSVGLIPPANL